MKAPWITTILVIASAPALANPTTVTSGDLGAGLHSWRTVDVRSGGMSRATTTRPDPAGGAGSLEQVLPGSGEYRTEIEIFSPDTVLEPGRGLVPLTGGYGLVADLRDLLISWYRDSSSTAGAWLGPAVRVYVFDPDLGINGTSSIMVWEPVYNGYADNPAFAVPADMWVHSRLDDETFWRQPLYLDGQRVPRAFCGDNPTECYVYDRRLQDWGFGPRAVIFGFNISAGSGWYGTYLGHVDYLSIEMPNARTWTWDFEPGAVQAPICPDTRQSRRRARRAARRAGRNP